MHLVMSFKQNGAMSKLNGNPLKLINPFTYLDISHQQKVISIYTEERHGLLLISYQFYGNQIPQIE